LEESARLHGYMLAYIHYTSDQYITVLVGILILVGILVLSTKIP